MEYIARDAHVHARRYDKDPVWFEEHALLNFRNRHFCHGREEMGQQVRVLQRPIPEWVL